ncbi:hypothetical protein BKA64DRAFT_646518 [Cadophora sp. MPI-SDFR-AT-0126]|nr:hypothetical protein BKA64DRAFT_646518 [Leotiomycetes sp. MPI-SDFR-AT-0126]
MQITQSDFGSDFLNDEAEEEAKLFAEALKAYDAEVPKKYKTGVDIDQPHSIGDVIKQIDSGVKEYKNEAEKTAWEALRKGFWKLGENKDGLESWLKLLPSSSTYGSLFCGSLKLIINAAGRLADVRSEAFKALADIPFHLESTKETVNTFNKSESLRKCGVKLYTVTLQALRHILEWFKKKAIGKTLAAFLKQGLYQKELVEKIKEIERISTRFKHISMGCMQREVVETRKAVTCLTMTTNKNHNTIKNTIEQTHQTLEELKLGDSKQHETTQRMLGSELATWKTQYLDLNRKTAGVLNDCKVLLENIHDSLLLSIRNPETMPNPQIDYQQQCVVISKDQPQYISDTEVQKDLYSSKILSALADDNDICETDLYQSLRALGTLTRSEQDCTIWVMKSSALSSWLLRTCSATLFINGSCSSTRACSPVTIVCACLIESLKSQVNGNFIPLQFFCGQHLSSATDSYATPLGLMNSLIAQLLLQHPDSKSSDWNLPDSSPKTLEIAQHLFKKLVAQLEAGTMVFCIIDGISIYEDAMRLVETKDIMHGLTELAKNKDGIGPVFKLLMTSSTRIKNLPEKVAKDEILNVPKVLRPQTGLSVLRNGKIRQREMS